MPVPIESRTAYVSFWNPNLRLCELTQVQVKPRVQAPPAPMLDQVLSRLERPEVLIAFPDRVIFSTAIIAISHQHGNLCAQLRQLERTCNHVSIPMSHSVSSRTCYCRNGSTCACTCQPKTCNCRERGVCAFGIGNDERRAAGSLVYPVIEGVFGALVNREGDGSNEGYTEKRRPDTYACR